ncbi:hypothetical protein [Schlesneria sp. DSM 10557]|uniref:hypothetical protein n=2 Tax=unclassified Schlesneria TaxID=2762017 RepID=UPI0035A01ACE
MSSTFFASIRRNQRQWMVVLTVLAMISFLFLDYVGRGTGPMSPVGGAILIGILCAAGMCVVGYPRQKATEFGLGGLLVGALVGFIGFAAMAQSKPVVRTAIGSFTRYDLEQLAQNRMRANQFLYAVARRVQSGMPSGFGGIDDPSLVQYKILLTDAQKMGIRISDEGVNDFLKEIGNNRMTQQDFRESLREARLGESELFDILKEELAARLAVKLTYPPATVVQVRPEFAQYTQTREPLRYMEQTPEQLWDAYQKMNLKQSLQAVAIPVQDFVSETAQPSDAELALFFEKYKTNRWIDEARPGFLQMPKVQLAYLTADFEEFEKRVNPTDEEVKEYFERNKDRYRAPETKESTAPKLPEGESTSSDASAPSSEELKSEQPVAPTEEKSEAEPVKEEPKAEEPKAEESQPEAPQSEQPEAQPEEKKEIDATEPKSESSCGEEPTNPEPTAKDEVVPETPAAEAAPAEPVAAEKTDEVKEREAATASETAPASPEATTEKPEQPAAESSEIEVPKLSESPESLPTPKLRELDDELKLEIREAIARERAFDLIATALDAAYEFMVPLGLDYDTTTDLTEKAEKAKTIAEKLKKYAEQHNLQYVETPEWEYEQLLAEPIGMAFESQKRSPVASDVLMRGDNGESRMPLYSPRRADLRTRRGSFAYWKINDLPARVTELKEEAVHERVVRAWKFDQARTLAEKRAKALAEIAKTEGNNLASAVSGESATGQKGDPALSLIETPEFTWLSRPQSLPSAQQEPTLTDIPLIPEVDGNFMKTVFEELKVGEVGVAPNANRSIYYVFKVKDRENAIEDGGVAEQERRKQFLAERFTGLYPIIKSPYESLAQGPQRVIDQSWVRNFESRNEVEWTESEATRRSRR